MIKQIYNEIEDWNYEVGTEYLTPENSKLINIKDDTYWGNGDNGWRGSIPSFMLSFKNGNSTRIYTTSTVFVRYTKE
jgi:hypothetical protein